MVDGVGLCLDVGSVFRPGSVDLCNFKKKQKNVPWIRHSAYSQVLKPQPVKITRFLVEWLTKVQRGQRTQIS